MLFWDPLDGLLRKLFGKQEGEKVYDAIGVLGGLVALVISVVTHRWWLAAGACLIFVLSGASLLRERRQRPDPSDDPGLLSGVASNPASLNPFHHEPLPPFPGTPDDEPK